MRYGLNLLYLLPGIVGGTEIYAAGLLAGLANIDQQDEFYVFVNNEAERWPLPEAFNFIRVVCPVQAVSRVKRYFFEQFNLPGLLKKHKIDLVHSLGYVAPLFPPCLSVVTVPDLNYRVFGAQMPLARRMALQLFVQQSVRRADHVITISNFARGQIFRDLGFPENKITVTHLAASFLSADDISLSMVMQKHGIKLPYIMAFSSSSQHKNIPCLVRAFGQARHDDNLPHQLVLLGHRPENDAHAFGMEGVILTGYVDEASKHTLLKNTEMLVFPSTYEGFGLPVLEAQQAGVPVACSTAASLPEVAGDAAVYFDPLSVDEMAKAIGKLAQDASLRAALKQKGFQNAGKFSWEQTARLTLEVYRKLINQ